MYIVLVVILLLLGASWGSFLNVVAYRLPRKKTFLSGRSKCTHCDKVIHWYDMIPILSWFLLRGKCRFCKHKLSIQYLIAEIVAGSLFVFGGICIQDWMHLLLYIVVISFFMVLFIYDIRAYIVPDIVSIPAIVIIFILNYLFTKDLLSISIGALVGGLWFLVQFVVSKGRWVGGGDIRLGVLMGSLLGYPLIFLGLGLAYVGGSIIAVLLILIKKKTMKSRLPFATLLLPATLIAWIWGDIIWEWYVMLIGV
jgi:prepilin signal peptidase PulO-like enzyme (type II secretory pathway)